MNRKQKAHLFFPSTFQATEQAKQETTKKQRSFAMARTRHDRPRYAQETDETRHSRNFHEKKKKQQQQKRSEASISDRHAQRRRASSPDLDWRADWYRLEAEDSRALHESPSIKLRFSPSSSRERRRRMSTCGGGGTDRRFAPKPPKPSPLATAAADRSRSETQPHHTQPPQRVGEAAGPERIAGVGGSGSDREEP